MRKIPEIFSEKIYAAAVYRVGFYANRKNYVGMIVQLKIVKAYAAVYQYVVVIYSGRVDGKAFKLAELR